jgi:hypothetical protein
MCVSQQGITDTALTIYDTATREHEQRGMTGAVGGVLRQLPPAVVKPLIMATEATSNVLGGMRNQIHPDARQEESQKWRQGEEWLSTAVQWLKRWLCGIRGRCILFQRTHSVSAVARPFESYKLEGTGSVDLLFDAKNVITFYLSHAS